MNDTRTKLIEELITSLQYGVDREGAVDEVIWRNQLSAALDCYGDERCEQGLKYGNESWAKTYVQEVADEVDRQKESIHDQAIEEAIAAVKKNGNTYDGEERLVYETTISEVIQILRSLKSKPQTT